MKQHVALVGFMAAGKSTLGKKVARKLKCAFYDLDDEIVKQHGPIDAIFYDRGEAAFRECELEALQAILDNGKPGIIALGGGAVTYEPTAKLLKKRVYRIFVKVSAEQILGRLRRSKIVRPLIGPTPSLHKIKELYAGRMPSYAHSDYVLEADTLTALQAVEAIVEWIRRKKLPFA